MPEGKKVEIRSAKGRPMLSWVGKRPLHRVTAFPAQLVETFSATCTSLPQLQGETAKRIWLDWPSPYPCTGLLFHGDNKEVLAHLLAEGFRGKVQLIYIDPPFDSGADYVRQVSLRGPAGRAKFDGDGYTLGEQIQYTDIWANDNYLQFMYERLLMLKELLAENGSIYLHCDSAKGHLLRCLMDEVFGPGAFIHEVIWFYSNKITDSSKRIFQRAHDTILGYGKSEGYIWNPPFEKRPMPVRNKKVIKVDGRRVNARDKEGNIIYVETDVKAMLDVWDIPIIGSRAEERVEYPTQKPESILERIIEATTNPGDLVLDCFIGSGTTAAVAQRLGRRWIGCDINKGAIQATAQRLQVVILEQAEAIRIAQPTMKPLPGMEPDPREGLLVPTQLAFSTYRVNDYDLQIQHNEAVELACAHLGIRRNRSESFFDGALGKRLVKIVPFNHPLSPLDLEEVKRELAARPEEERDVVVVCLGKEVAADAWLEEWNRLRTGRAASGERRDVPNKIETIELRSDERYGKFFVHQPDQARVHIERVGENIHVQITDFVSPTIIERLQQQAGLLAPQIHDWRAMVDSVMIDSSYKGQVFNIILADVPERKSDLVQGEYTLLAPQGLTTIAVKIIDMLGEEVLVTKQV